MKPVDWKKLVRVCKDEGCHFERQTDSHYIMTKDGLAQPVIIPRRKNLKEYIVFSVGRTLGLTIEEISERLNSSKKKLNHPFTFW